MTPAPRWLVSARGPRRLDRAAVAIALALAVGCASGRPTDRAAGITPVELLRGGALGLTGGPQAPIPAAADVLAMSPGMEAFVAAHVGRDSPDDLKLQQLVDAIMNKRTFGLTYDETTRTAADTFRVRHGNCLSFSNMFVAMARAVGLDAQFQEVDVPPDWTFANDTFVLNRHVDVFVNLRAQGTRVVDFNIADFRSSYEMRTISDRRALAHFYNNLGVERMQAGDAAAALECFRTAVGLGESSFSPAWTNLGTLYLRRGRLAHAEAAYLHSLDVNSSDLVAMSDLAHLFDRLGDTARAAAYRARVARHRWLNPYYRYELARRAYETKRYDEAIPHLKFAVRETPKEDRFCHLLSLCYLGKGDLPAARRWLARAEEVAATAALKRTYAAELAALPGSPPADIH